MLNKKFFSIAVDGLSASGKSTIAKKLAKLLDFAYLDTGALYRSVAYYFYENNINFDDENLVLENLKKINIKFDFSDFNQEMFLNNINITKKIRNEEISIITSKVSSYKCVRDFLINFQRDFSKCNNVIMDGRDIGTKVLIDANIKFFIKASIDIRAKRRFNELFEKGFNINIKYEDVYNSIKERDFNDSTRKICPITISTDAIIIDTSNLTLEESVEIILEKIKFKIRKEI